MFKNAAFQRSVACLTHPLSIGAAILLFLNNFLFQPHFASWWTGKIGDFAWMIFVPFLAAICLSWFIRQETILGIVSLATAGSAFALVKTVPLVNSIVVQGVGKVLGMSAKISLDPTDLLVLPALSIAWIIWKTTSISSRPLSSTRLASIVILALMVLADAAAPIDKGIGCLASQNGSIIAIRASIYQGKTNHWKVYRSEDGGMNWTYITQIISGSNSTLTPEENDLNTMVSACKDNPSNWEYVDPSNQKQQYLFMSQNDILLSEDGGGNYHKIYDLTGTVYDALHDPSNGNLVLAAGSDGIIILTSKGDWSKIPLTKFDSLNN